jgi:uncharacterized protein YdhG (YjbR/CyaY superfamily)
VTPPVEKKPSFSTEERTAMKERAAELKAPRNKKASGEADMMDKISAMDPLEQKIAQRLHALVTEHAPHLAPKTWYGMPAWAKDGTVICFFQAASKFKTRYSTLGFDENAALDEGNFWPTAFAITQLTPEIEQKIVALITKASS